MTQEPLMMMETGQSALPACPCSRSWRILVWTAQIVVAAILLQTLYFKFTYAPETRVIFADLGGRPMATLVGIVELACVVLLLIPRTAVFGAVLALGVIMGAIFSHLFLIGLQVTNPETGEKDGGLLFALALVVMAGAGLVLSLRWRELPRIDRVFKIR